MMRPTAGRRRQRDHPDFAEHIERVDRDADQETQREPGVDILAPADQRKQQGRQRPAQLNAVRPAPKRRASAGMSGDDTIRPLGVMAAVTARSMSAKRPGAAG